jgi:hypothetical protein
MSTFSTNMTISISFTYLIIIFGIGFSSLQDDDSTKEYKPNLILLFVDNILGDFVTDVQSDPINIFNYPIVFVILGVVLLPPFLVFGGLYYTVIVPKNFILKTIRGKGV